MKFKLPVIVVKDMEQSRKFYEELLDLKVVLDFGANITFDGGLSLQTRDVWRGFIGSEDTIICRPNNFELYFEEKHFDQFIRKLKSYKDTAIELVHEAKEYPWGQRVIRFYDPDKHIIEVGESMATVIRRFHEQGMSVEEIVERSQHPAEFVREALNEKVQKRLVGVKCRD
jgi:catechol 2,3-dioxygenase-like lactoylglutathione lyase family enzyme